MVILGRDKYRESKSRWRKVYGSRECTDKLILGVRYYGQITSVVVIYVVSIGSCSCSGTSSDGASRCGCRGRAVMIAIVILAAIGLVYIWWRWKIVSVGRVLIAAVRARSDF